MILRREDEPPAAYSAGMSPGGKKKVFRRMNEFFRESL